MRTTMYFDGGCPFCLRGVRHLQRCDWARRIDWVDLQLEPDALLADGLDFSRAMQSLRVRGRDGRLCAGAAALVAVWAELPGYRWLARALSRRWALAAAEALYRASTWRRRARFCGAGACRPAPTRSAAP